MINFASLERGKRHPADYRDDIEHEQVAAVLSQLPEDHPARLAYYNGAREGSDSIQLSRLLGDRPELAKRLVDAHLAHSNRIWERSGHFRP